MHANGSTCEIIQARVAAHESRHQKSRHEIKINWHGFVGFSIRRAVPNVAGRVDRADLHHGNKREVAETGIAIMRNQEQLRSRVDLLEHANRHCHGGSYYHRVQVSGFPAYGPGHDTFMDAIMARQRFS